MLSMVPRLQRAPRSNGLTLVWMKQFTLFVPPLLFSVNGFLSREETVLVRLLSAACPLLCFDALFCKW